tara:strand:+ start:2657 stop:3079 length:423 start_codon:yes stop_codon:yes gene_type:complete
MPKSKVRKTRLFREFSRMDSRYVNRNYLKYYRSVKLEFCDSKDISSSHLDFLVWAYDLEFFTKDFASEDYEMNKKKLGERVIYPLMNMGFIYKHFDRLTPSQTAEDHLFRDETKMNYRVRYAITQKARLLVQAFYRELED